MKKDIKKKENKKIEKLVDKLLKIITKDKDAGEIYTQFCIRIPSDDKFNKFFVVNIPKKKKK